MGFGEDSLVYAMRVTYDQAEADVRSAFAVLSKQAGTLSITGGVAPGTMQSIQSASSAQADMLAMQRASRDVLANERLLLDEILKLELLGLDASKARSILDDKANLVLAQQEKKLGEVVAARRAELQLTAEIQRQRLIGLRDDAGTAGLSKAQLQALTLAELTNEQERLTLVLKKAEAGLEKEIAVAKKYGIDVSEAQTVLDQKRSFFGKALVKDAQEEAIARQIALQTAQTELSVLNKQYALAHAAQARANRDAMGKSFGGVRGVMPINNFEDLGKSFASAEGLRARTLSLFSGQIGTLAAYAAAFAVVQAAYGVTITRNVELQQELQRLSVVVEDTTGAHGEALRQLRSEAISWSDVHGQKLKEIVASYYELGAAGLDTVQILKGGFASLLLSEGGFLKLGDAVELLQSQYQTFAREGNSFVDLANITQVTAAKSATTVEELGVAYKYTSASAQTAGTSFRELNALLGTLANLGLRGSIAGTSLNQVFTQLTKKRAEIEALGISVIDASGQMRSFIDILADFKKVFGATLSGGEQEILKDIFDVRGARAMERLIQDTTVLPKLLGEVDSSSTAAFAAAEKGANTATEAVKVLGNQIANLLLIGKAPDFFRDFFDSLTNRPAERALQNMQSSASGLEYELEKLSRAMSSGSDEAGYWILSLAEAGKNLDGPLGDALRDARKEVGLLNQGFDIFQLSVPERMVRARNLSKETIDHVFAVVQGMGEVGRAQEDIVKGGNILEALFGRQPLSEYGSVLADSIARGGKDVERAFVEEQARISEALFDAHIQNLGGGVSDQTKGLFEEAKFWSDKLAGLGEPDVAETKNRLDAEKQLRAERLKTWQTEIDLMSQATSLEFDERKKMIQNVRDISLFRLEQEKQLVLDNVSEEAKGKIGAESAVAARKLEIEKQFQNARDGIVKKANAEMRAEDLRALQELYGTRQRLAEQERRLVLDQADLGAVSGLEKGFAQDEFLRRGNELVAQLDAGGLTFAQFADQFQIAENQYTSTMSKVARDEKARETALLELGGNVAILEARSLVKRVDLWTAFENERTNIRANADLQRKILDAQYWNDEATLILKQRELHLKTEAEITASRLNEEDARKQAALDSFALIGDSFGQLSGLMSALSNDTTATMLGGLSQVVDAAGNAINILDRMKAGSLGSFAGVLGIASLVAGLAGSFLSSRRREDEQARMLADEFRAAQGSTPTADFGKAQVVNMRNEVTIHYRSLGKPSLAEQKDIAEEVVDEVEDLLVQRGFGSHKS